MLFQQANIFVLSDIGTAAASTVGIVEAGSWPTGLPQCPILNGFSEQRQRNIAAFQADVGPPKMRRRSTAVAVVTSVIFRMTGDELDTFNLWYVDYQADGTLPFTWTHPVTQVEYSWVFDSKDAPRIDRMTPNTFRVSFTLLRLP